MSAQPTAPRRSLRRRLRIGFGAIAAAFALLSIAAVASLDRLGDAIATILRENYASVVHCEQMKEALERQDSAALFAASGREDIAAPMLRDNRASFEDALSREERNITLPGEGEMVRDLRAGYTSYAREVDRALALPGGEQRAAYFRELLPRVEALKDLVQRILRLNQAHMEDANGRAKRLARGTVHGALAVSVAALAFVVWFALWLVRSTTRPLEALTRSAKAIGEGDLAVSVAEPETSELATLASAFNHMTERLRLYRESSLGELLAAKDLARSTLECMLDPVVVLDREGGVLLANEAAERAFAIRIGSAEELRHAEIAVPDELAGARDRALDSGAPVLPRSLSEAVRRRTDAGERHYLVRALPLGSAPRDRQSAIVLAQDVTRFRRIDDLKSDMVATVSHELKTPLTSLRMATHLLLEPATGALTEPQRELVTTARDDAERLRATVEELLDVVRIEAEAGALRRVPVDPSALLHEIADAHAAIARDKGVAIDVEPPAAGRVDMDPERISIALANLVSNAIRHTPPGGHVRLRAKRDGGSVRIDVVDDGEGVAPELLPRIFDRSFTTRGGADGPRGHGLGLAIAREIALQHGGDLHAESAPGAGSTFSLVIPIEPSD